MSTSLVHNSAMNAPTHDISAQTRHARPGKASPQIGGQMLAMRWAALADAGAVAAMLAGVDDDEADAPVQAALGALTGWRGAMVEQQMATLSVVMESGLGAILAVREQGQDCSAAADALWREFNAARGAIRALLEAA